jgi:sugar-specific transcriptional regulator TrmB
MVLEKALKQLGLTEKEIKVYLSALELGPQPVQEIAKRAGVNRATTYVMIEQLTQHGLMSSFEKGKKRFFTAEDPEKLHNIIKSEQRELKEKEDLISNIMPDLRAVYSVAEHKPRVRFFEGAEGVIAIQQDIIDTRVNHLEHAVDIDEYRKVFHDDDLSEQRDEYIKQGLKIKGIFTTSGVPAETALKPKELGWEYVMVDKKKFNFPGELIIYDKKVAMISYSGKIMGVIIESAEINIMISTIFKMAWESMKK